MEKASRAYYDGEPIISNEEYDALEQKFGMIIAGAGEIPHKYRMYSLKKHYDKDGQPPLDLSKCVETPKLDGAAVALTYVTGEFLYGLTRGDGKKGRDITEKLKYLVPATFMGNYQVEGEVVASSSVENSRNYASGALNLKNIDEFLSRVSEGEMKFVAYGVKPSITGSYTEDMAILQAHGFNTATSFNPTGYPTDGRVFRLDSNTEFESLGFTEKFPRGAFAWKDEQESVETTLLDVVWRTGKSGKVTPIAILEPVVIGEAEISRATLNNIAYIEALELEIGCTVKLIRSGEIIPKIVGRVFD